ncbi:hypothetical protein, partial [Pseudomonas lactis]|uniref:hypothetical protein n=1 Tax=Pseudomonas lactis TaxID=1615674 RepID=UPI001F269D03
TARAGTPRNDAARYRLIYRPANACLRTKYRGQAMLIFRTRFTDITEITPSKAKIDSLLVRCPAFLLAADYTVRNASTFYVHFATATNARYAWPTTTSGQR